MCIRLINSGKLLLSQCKNSIVQMPSTQLRNTLAKTCLVACITGLVLSLKCGVIAVVIAIAYFVKQNLNAMQILPPIESIRLQTNSASKKEAVQQEIAHLNVSELQDRLTTVNEDKALLFEHLNDLLEDGFDYPDMSVYDSDIEAFSIELDAVTKRLQELDLN